VTAATGPVVVRIATFNAHHAADDGFFRRHRALVDTCRSLDADVLALQELDRHSPRTCFRNQPNLVARALAMKCVVAPAKRVPFGGRQCNALCARGPLRDLEVLELPQPPELEPRNAIVARVALPGLELTVAATHLHHRPRANARPQLELILETLAARPGPRVVAGDFNLATEEAVPILRAAGYTPVEVEPTSPRLAPREQIDWIACDEGFSVVHAEVHEPLVSDHLPVVVTLALNG
jgi:endonuclease/exonuclease/phosphatase family metal-dependent hydrolase